jgi:hypothetical protein
MALREAWPFDEVRDMLKACFNNVVGDVVAHFRAGDAKGLHAKALDGSVLVTL